ncbi:unnamed protein product [Leuciscus chuanchicus]
MELHRIVTSHVIHGPCGQWNSASPCMVDKKCTKDYPKQLRQNTSFSDNSYPLNQRRTEGAPGSPIIKTIRGGVNVPVNNTWVVPYNPYLLLRYNAHINVEIVCVVSSVKYLYKYLEKGPDQCMVRLDVPDDETREILRRDEQKQPPVKMLAIHLEDEQVIMFNDEGAAQNLLDSGPPATTLIAFFEAMFLHPHMLRDVRAETLERPISSRLFRLTAYRQFTLWARGHLGRRNRIPIPSCAVNYIRDLFPSAEYQGFEYALDL